jgi:hypothetical protein
MRCSTKRLRALSWPDADGKNTPSGDRYRSYAKWSQRVSVHYGPSGEDRSGRKGWGETPVAAIPGSAGAWRAPCGVIYALLRVAVLGGLSVAAWLLGSGTGHADEPLIRLVTAASTPSDGESAGLLDVPSASRSALTKVLPATPVPELPAQPLVQLRDLVPMAKAVDVPELLAPESRPLAAPVQHRAAIRQAPAEQAGTAPPIAPARLAAPAASPQPAAVLTAHSHAPATIAARNSAHPVVDLSGGRLIPSNGPRGPIPANPPESTNTSCLIGGTGGGASTKRAPDLAVSNSGAATHLAQPHCLWQLGASSLPRSPAAQPSTSPD